jgi:hypothetical protein
MSADTNPAAPAHDLPSDVKERLGYWHGVWRASAQYHYAFGVVSVAASVISTSLEGGPAKACSIVAAIATALIGFMHPERRYVKFVRAWRVLDLAAMRYRHGLIGRAELINAVSHGEALIAEFEDKYSDGGAGHGAETALQPGALHQALQAAQPVKPHQPAQPGQLGDPSKPGQPGQPP